MLALLALVPALGLLARRMATSATVGTATEAPSSPRNGRASILSVAAIVFSAVGVLFCDDPQVCHSVSRVVLNAAVVFFLLIIAGPGVFALSVALYRHEKYKLSIVFALSTLLLLLTLGAIRHLRACPGT
jgi:hypothetical protein